MGSRGRSRAERQGAQSGAGTGRAVLEGSGSDAPGHAHPLHSTIEGVHRARSWIWVVARRGIVGRPNEIKSQESTCVIVPPWPHSRGVIPRAYFDRAASSRPRSSGTQSCSTTTFVPIFWDHLLRGAQPWISIGISSL